MTVGFFAAMFPTHVCFNKQMMIEHCGEFLYNELDMAKRRTTKITDVFSLVQPDDVPMTFKGIHTYINSIYILRLKQNLKRNTLLKGSGRSPKGPVPLSFKGQMVMVNGGNNIIYMSSPYVSSVRGLIEANLFISDFNRHDATRDLIMLNQSRISQQELK